MDHTAKWPAHQLCAPRSHTLHGPPGSWFLGANASILCADRSTLPFPPCRSFSAVPSLPLSTCSVPLCTAAPGSPSSGLRGSSQWGPRQEQGKRKGRKAGLCGVVEASLLCRWPQLRSRDHSSQQGRPGRPWAGPGHFLPRPSLQASLVSGLAQASPPSLVPCLCPLGLKPSPQSPCVDTQQGGDPDGWPTS